MFSRTKRIFGVAALTVAAATAMAVPAHAGDEPLKIQLLKELTTPFCLPNPGAGIPILDELIPQLMGCNNASSLD
jgi:hypothetical protein